jgi:alpha,alpha-trehalase
MKGDLTGGRFDAVLFDLDGVLTDTARIHEASWKKMFDAFLKQRAKATGEPFRPFEMEDYELDVDGGPRYDGVRDFLKSRGIELPEGSPEDPPDRETVCGLGNRKNQMVTEVIKTVGVDAYPGSVALVRYVRDHGTAYRGGFGQRQLRRGPRRGEDRGYVRGEGRRHRTRGTPPPR